MTNWFTFLSSNVNTSLSIVNFPSFSHPIVEKTLTLSPTDSVASTSFVNVVLDATVNLPFILDSERINSYRSSPSNLPVNITLSTTAEANLPVVCVIFLPIRLFTSPDKIFALIE